MHNEMLAAICESTDNPVLVEAIVQIYGTCFPEADPLCEGLLNKLAKGAAIGSLALGLSHAASSQDATTADYGSQVSEIAHDNTFSYIADNIREGHITKALDIMSEINKSTLNGDEAKRYKKYEDFIATKYPSILANHQINQRLSKIEDYVDRAGLSVNLDKVTKALTKFTPYQQKLMAPPTTERIKQIYQKAKDNHYKAHWCKENSVSVASTKSVDTNFGSAYKDGIITDPDNTTIYANDMAVGGHIDHSLGNSVTTQVHYDPRDCTQMAQNQMNALETRIMDDMDKLETAPKSPRTVRRANALYDKYDAEFDDLKRKGATPTYPDWRSEWSNMMDTISAEP